MTPIQIPIKSAMVRISIILSNKPCILNITIYSRFFSILISYDGKNVGSFESFGQIGKPDYSNQETINRITANNGTWTADRDGYCNCEAYLGNNSTGSSAHVFVNSKRFAYNFGKTAALVMVTKGDVVKVGTGGTVSTNATFSCYFIPPEHTTGSISGLVCISY